MPLILPLDFCNFYEDGVRCSVSTWMINCPPERKGMRDTLDRHGAVIKAGKYSCGHYIFNAALIKSDTDHRGGVRWTFKGVIPVLQRKMNVFSRPNLQ